MKKLAFLSLFLGVGLAIFVSNTASGETRPALFSLKESPQARAENEKSSIASVRESEIVFNNAQEIDAARLKFPLFDGKIYQAARVESEFRAVDDYTWRGKIREGKFSGDVILTFKKGFVSGLIYAPNAVYEIVARGEKEILVELNQSLFPECAGDVKGDAPKTNFRSESAVVGVDSGDRIDVLVLYTTPVKNSLGGDAQAQAFAQQAIDATNTAYLNSKIRQRVRLVHAQETTVAETGNLSTELPALRNDATVNALRSQHKADLVAMLSNSSNACGIGYLMGGLPGNANNGFTVTSRTCAVGNLSFPHELGHNMGSAHNPENGSGGTYSYSFGHNVNGSYRTVMAYVDPCTSGCVRHPYFSNPSIIFMNAPTGVDNARDNARSINNTADSTAAYQYSGASLTLSGYNGGETIPRNLSRTVSWSSDNLSGNVKIEISRDASTSWQTLIASTANDGSEIINVYGRPTRQARIRISSLDNPAVSDSSVNNISIR
jgi:peptidyl-Asp metalloendopeptidase